MSNIAYQLPSFMTELYAVSVMVTLRSPKPSIWVRILYGMYNQKEIAL